jgi:post-segregation antitoxin (ccd killing protein)
MPKITVYLPEGLYREARDRALPLSALAQHAVEDAVRRARATDWVERVGSRRPRVKRRIDTSALIEQVRDEFGG